MGLGKIDVPSRDGHGHHYGRQSCVPSYRMDIWRSFIAISLKVPVGVAVPFVLETLRVPPGYEL